MTVSPTDRSKLSKPWRILAVVIAVAFALLAALVAYFVLWGLRGLSAPERPKWNESVGAFEQVVTTMPPAPTGDGQVSFDVPPKLGAYDIGSAVRIRQGALFYDSDGCGFLDDAGIAYLPDGPSADMENGGFEAPDYRGLGGPWYSFCASW